MNENLGAVDAYIMVNPSLDNVAVSRIDLKRGSRLVHDKKTVTLKQPVDRGQRFAVRDIPAGEHVVQYGHPFGISTGIATGELIHSGNVLDIQPDLNEHVSCEPPETDYSKELVARTFEGFKRPGRSVGTRNYYLIVPTSQCASQTAVSTGLRAQESYNLSVDFPNVDGIVTIPNTEGCGCASNVQIDRFLRVLRNFVTHPNVGGVLIVDLGCEQTNYAVLYSYLKGNDGLPTVPADWLTIQKEGGTEKTIIKALEVIGRRLPAVNAARRTACPIGHLVVGTECGASDAFSGITANRLIGAVVDKVIAGKGSAILSEIPEMVGAEHILIRRMRSPEMVTKFRSMVNWYRDLARALGVDMSDNLVPENRAGGLINPCIKSLGAVTKGGTTAIVGVLDYAQRLSTRGLHIMQGPGNDMESITGMVASGANIICFSTGKGGVTGSAIVPVVKISSTSEVYQRMPGDIDFDAGQLFSAHDSVTVQEITDTLLDMVIAVASGEKTKSEENEQRQFQVWTAGKLSL